MRCAPAVEQTFDFVDFPGLAAVETAVRPGATQMLWCETPSNPTLKLTDVAAVATVAKRHGCLLVVDNTFLSPFFQQPLRLGADVVMHSATKYLGGHSDVVGGALATDCGALAERLRFAQAAGGAVPSPFD